MSLYSASVAVGDCDTQREKANGASTLRPEQPPSGAARPGHQSAVRVVMIAAGLPDGTPARLPRKGTPTTAAVQRVIVAYRVQSPLHTCKQTRTASLNHSPTPPHTHECAKIRIYKQIFERRQMPVSIARTLIPVKIEKNSPPHPIFDMIP
jgi:hypothetical protein